MPTGKDQSPPRCAMAHAGVSPLLTATPTLVALSRMH